MNKKILIIDDEADICNVLKRHFTERGYTVFVSQEGGEALGILKTERPEVMIVDIKMPGLNGIEVLELAKQVKNNIKVIIISAIRDEAIVKETMALGASAYISKPFKLEDLEKKITGKD